MPDESATPRNACPACGAADPVWFGRWKAVALLVAIGGVLLSYETRWTFATSMVAVIVVLIASAAIPDFECASCGRRWKSR